MRLTILTLCLLLTSFLSACGNLPKQTTDPELAARIYTDLAYYYWQSDYQDLAFDRLQLALQHKPNYPRAKELFELWQRQISP